MDVTGAALPAWAARGRSDTGAIVGLLHLVPRPDLPGAGARRLDRFGDVNVISYLASWVVTGTASGADGAATTLSLRLDDEANTLTLYVDARQWEARYPGEGVKIANDPAHRKLSVIVERAWFSASDPAWFLQADSVIHIRATEER